MHTPLELPELSALVLAAAWKGVIVMGIAALVSVLVLRRSAAVRHLVWCSALLALIAIPVADALLPAWRMDLPTEFVARFDTGSPTEAVTSTGVDATQVNAPLRTTQRTAEFDSKSANPVPPADTAPARIVLPPVDVLLWLVWLGGFLFVLSDILIGHVVAWRTTRAAARVVGAPRRIMEEAAASLTIDRPIDLRSSRAVRVPCTWGAVRTTVLLPDEHTEWSSDRLRMVLTHELGHAKRYDWLTQTLTHVACALHWFNPLVWVARSKMIRDQEEATDDLVLRSGNVAHEYATNLLDIARTMRPREAMFSLAHATIAMSRPSTLEGRLIAILDETRHRTVVHGRKVVGIALIVSASLIPLAMVQPSTALQEEHEVAELETVESLLNESSESSVEISDLSAEAAAPNEEPRIASSAEPDPVAAPDMPETQETHETHETFDDAATGDTTRVRALLAALAAEEDQGVRLQLVHIIGELDSPLATQPLIALVANDPSDKVRSAAANALAEMEAPEAIATLSRALADDPSPEVRRHAAWALTELESRDSLPALREALRNDESAEIRQQAAHAIAEFGDESDIPLLEASLDDSDPKVRAVAVWALGEMDSAGSAAALERALQDDDAHVAKSAAHALGELEGEAAVEALSRATAHADHEVRTAAVWALGEIGSDKAVVVLSTVLGDEEESTRVQAAWALGEIGSETAADALIRALEDESAEVRKNVARALGEIGVDKAADALIRMLREDPDPQVRKSAAWALSEIDF